MASGASASLPTPPSAAADGGAKAIGDSGEAQRLIKTVHGRGFRFVATSTARRGRRATLGRMPARARRRTPGPFKRSAARRRRALCIVGLSWRWAARARSSL